MAEAENQLKRKGHIVQQQRTDKVHSDTRIQNEREKMARMIYLDTSTLRKGERVSDS